MVLYRHVFGTSTITGSVTIRKKEKPSNVPHWHGASPTVDFVQIAVTPNTAARRARWMQPVTDQEYKNVEP